MTVYFWNCDWIARFILSIHNPTKKASLESNALCIEVRYAISYTVRSCNAISKSFPYIACKQLFNSIKDVLDTRLGVNEAWVEKMLLEFETWDCGAWMLEFGVNGWCMYHQRRQYRTCSQIARGIWKKILDRCNWNRMYHCKGLFAFTRVAPVVNKVISRSSKY